MRVAISGGTGFLGSFLRKALVAQGHTVQVTSRGGAGVTWNPGKEALPLQAARDIDVFVHLAGEPLLGRWTAGKKKRVWDSRVAGTKNLSEGFRRLAQTGAPLPRVLIAGSAIGFYGDTGDTPVDESASPGRGFLAELGRQWEEAAKPVSDLGVRVVYARTGLVLDPRHGLLKQMLWPFRLGLGGRLGHGGQWMSWIHRDDWVNTVRWCIDSKVEGPVNLTAPHPVRNDEFSGTLAAVLHRPAFLPVPAWALRLLLGEMGDNALQSQRILPHAALQGGYDFAFPDLRAALLDLL